VNLSTGSDPALIYGVPWSDALAAIGTVGAVVVAVVLALIEFGRSRRQARRAQAELISAWSERHALHGWADAVHNGSTSAIYNVSVQDTKGGSALPWIVIPPGKTEYLPTQGDRGFTSPLGTTFTDSAGRGWRRRPDGHLERCWSNDAIEFANVGRFPEARRWIRRHTITRG
jgi:hypothetical protein